MPRVTVIMPTFNRAQIITRAIDSVLTQTWKDFELIIIDDASTDNTTELLNKYNDDQRIRYHRLSTNVGAAAARNQGLSKAQGEIIAYLDSDNLWHPNYLEVMISELSETHQLVYSNQNLLLIEGSHGQFKTLGRLTRRVEYNPIDLLSFNFIDINAVVHYRDLIDQIGQFDESLTALEDWDLFVRLAIKYPFAIKHVDQVLGDYFYYKNNELTTITNSEFPEELTLRQFHKGLNDPASMRILKKIRKYRSEASV